MKLIIRDFDLFEREKGQWIVHLDEQYFAVSEQAKQLLDVLQNSANNQDATERFNTQFDTEFTEKDFTTFYQNLFKEIPLFPDSEILPKSKSYIRFQTKILPSKIAGKLAKPFQFLYQPSLFYVLFTIVSILILYLILTQDVSHIHHFPMVEFMLFYFVTSIFHELGHIAACNKFTGKNGEIGFGIYFLFPVFYSNISPIWTAKKSERIITNLAGVFIQMLIVLGMMILYFFTLNETYLLFGYLMGIYSIIQLLPFIRSDGYWIVADLIEVPNFLNASREEVKNWIKKPIAWFHSSTKKQGFLLGYGLFTYLILGGFLLYQLIFNSDKILDFPKDLLHTIEDVIRWDFSHSHFDLTWISVFIFYYFILNFSIKEIRKLFKPKLIREQ